MMRNFLRAVPIVAATLFAASSALPARGQSLEGVFDGHKIIIPESSIPQPGKHHTNYFYVDSDQAAPQPPPGVETPGSVACVYKLVKGPAGCPVATSTALPTGGVGAVAIVDAGDYPTAASDLAATLFSVIVIFPLAIEHGCLAR